MAIIKPFMGLRPHPSKVEEVASVPYDVINREEASALVQGKPNSFLRVVRSEVDLPNESNPYAPEVYQLANDRLNAMKDEGVLVQDQEPSMYLYRITMGEHVQTGLVCCSSVDDYENDIIKKHEKTRPAKEDDRTKHIESTGAHTGPVFLTFRSTEQIAQAIHQGTSGEPLYDFTAEDGVRHTLWRTSDCDQLCKLFAELPCTYVADGHHRIASAARCRELFKNKNGSSHSGEEAYNFFLSVLFPDNEVAILPYNRIIFSLGSQTEDTILSQLGEVVEIVPDAPAEPTQKGQVSMYLGGKWYQLTLFSRDEIPSDPVSRLEVSMLHSKVLAPIFGIGDERTDDNIDFVGGIRGTKFLEELVDSGKASCAFSVFATSMDELMTISDEGLIMAPKSTWFEPKLRSGLLIHKFDDAPPYSN